MVGAVKQRRDEKVVYKIHGVFLGFERGYNEQQP
jgi:hypothetical protein